MKRPRLRVTLSLGLFVFLLPFFGLVRAAHSGPLLVLSLGEDYYLPKGSIEVNSGAQFLQELGNKQLEEVQLVILSNIDYHSLPAYIRDGLVDYVRKGGSLLITGGDRSYGSGGYSKTSLASILPFTILSPRDWWTSRIGQIEPLATGHPVFSDLNFLKMPLVNTFNDLGRAEGSNLIAQFQILDRQPLIAERKIGNGLVFGIAFNMREISSLWPEADRFCLNLIQYLLQRSAISPR